MGPSPPLSQILNEDALRITTVGPGATIGPRETKAVRTLERMLRDYGPGHVRAVLSLLVESENNSRELVAANIQAVSRLIIAHPEWSDVSGWFDVFDAAPIASYRRIVSRNVAACPVAEAMTTILYLRLAHRFGSAPEQPDMFDGGQL